MNPGVPANGLPESEYISGVWRSSTGALALCDQRGIVLRVNEAFLALFRFPSRDHCLGRDLDSLITPAPWMATADSASSMAAGGRPMATTMVKQTSGGKELLRVFAAITSVSDNEGRKHLLHILRHIPPESGKRSTDSLILPDEFSAAFEASCEPSLITGSGGEILRCNPAFSAEFGWTQANLRGAEPSAGLIPPGMAPEEDYIRAMTSAGRLLRLETGRLDSTGEERRVSLLCVPLADGTVYRVYRTTESRAITENDLLAGNRFRACPESALRGGMLFQCRTDRQRTMEFVAPDSGGFTGYSDEELLSGRVAYGSVIDDLDREMVMKAVQDSLLSGREYSITYRIRNSSGRTLWVMEQARAFRSGLDSVDFCEGCIVDITGTMEKPGRDDSARDRIEKLHTVAGELQKSRSAGEIYRICAEAGLSILDGVCSCIFLQDGNDMKIVASAGKEEYPCERGCSLGMAQVALNTLGPCYFRSRDRGEGFCPAGTAGVCFRLGKNAVFQVMSRSRSMFGNVDTRILELLLGYTGQGLKRIALQHQLISQALHDPLTGIYNRNYFNRLIQLEEHRARRLDSAISFIMVDVDNFKHINDHYGHQIGDRVLQAVAGVLEDALRKTDTVLRYGGDEFLIILTRMTKDYTHVVETRIRESLQGSGELEGLDGERITVSMGHAFWTPDCSETIDEVLKVADMLMLENKKRKARKR